MGDQWDHAARAFVVVALLYAAFEGGRGWERALARKRRESGGAPKDHS